MKSAVLVIDLQSALLDPDPRPDEIDAVIERINKLTHRARNAKVPVIFIQHEAENSVLAYDAPGWQLQSNLDCEEIDIIVRKTTPDSFLRTNLEQTLQYHDINNLIICGYATEFCVDTTTRRAAALGYTVQLVSDAHTTHDKDHANAREIRTHHSATLPNITSFGPKIQAIQAVDIVLNN
ncbi:cysteine hydrolase family protein [Kiloniella laminariae]|uniref:cysteine hydrolase family protein n=1 Tax=Kiloniella laminariae TaxID=454162 RepID=UPI00037EC518|nr:cysteine hydrolase family protein [Kiloniella laminariae]